MNDKVSKIFNRLLTAFILLLLYPMSVLKYIGFTKKNGECLSPAIFLISNDDVKINEF
jgi:hypothetical protein